MLFIYCFALRHKSSQVRILWEDHRNDLWINGFGRQNCSCSLMSDVVSFP